MKIKQTGVSMAVIVGALVLSGWFGEASAQATPEQIAAIRQSCRSDFMSHCAGVQPGGRGACNASSAMPAACRRRARRRLMRLDRSRLRAALSLLLHRRLHPRRLRHPRPTRRSRPPKRRHRRHQLNRPRSSKPSRRTPPGTGPSEATTPGAPQVAAVRAACRSDFGVHCPGVRPGGTAALRCLQVNAAALSPRCRSAVEAMGEGPAHRRQQRRHRRRRQEARRRARWHRSDRSRQ